jgi:hypothetical protein
MTKRNRRIFIFAVILVLLGIAIFAPHPQKIGVTTTAQAPAVPKSETVTVNDNGANPPYSVDVQYPKFSGLSDQKMADAVNADIKASVDSAIAGFKNNLSVPPAPGLKNMLTVRYTIAYLTPHILSFEVSDSQIVAGGAHPNTDVETFTYDLRSGKRVRLADLFKSDADYLTALSNYVMPMLQNKLNAKPDDADALDWIQSGASPKGENYQNFLIGKEGLVIVFQQYQVAPYAAGVQRITVPYPILQTLADPAGLLAVRVAD